MIEVIKNALSERFINLNFDLTNWSEVLEASSYASVYHQASTVEYYSAYFLGENISFVLTENNSPVAIFPIFVYQHSGKWKISSNGFGIISPLFISNIPKKLRKRLEQQIIEIVEILSSKLKLKKIIIFEHSTVLSNWFLLWLAKADTENLTYQLAIDLRQSIETIKLDFRKSYKPLVNKALKEWDVKICEEDLNEEFEDFRKLHLEAAGKQTRSRESWNIQKKQIQNKQAFLITVRDGPILIGAGLFNFSRDEGIYSVGAYKRDLFDKPIGHAVQMIAIEKLKNLGCQTYILGQKSTGSSSEKEVSISHFKEGFAGYVYVQPHLEVNINE